MCGAYVSESTMADVLLLLMFCRYFSQCMDWSAVCNCAIVFCRRDTNS